MTATLLLLFLLNGAASAVTPAPRVPIPVHVYTDPANGVSFQYPIVWKTVTSAGDIWGSQAFNLPGTQGKGVPITVAVQFTGKGNLYAKTTLISLNFLYGNVPGSSPAACRKIAAAADPRNAQVTINGVAFTHGISGDAGMGQSVRTDIYTTLRSGRCFVFEEDFRQNTGPMRPGQRSLTPQETDALQGHLNAIPQTIRFR